jgi:hypothetical protein
MKSKAFRYVCNNDACRVLVVFTHVDEQMRHCKVKAHIYARVHMRTHMRSSNFAWWTSGRGATPCISTRLCGCSKVCHQSCVNLACARAHTKLHVPHEHAHGPCKCVYLHVVDACAARLQYAHEHVACRMPHTPCPRFCDVAIKTQGLRAGHSQEVTAEYMQKFRSKTKGKPNSFVYQDAHNRAMCHVVRADTGTCM